MSLLRGCHNFILHPDWFVKCTDLYIYILLFYLSSSCAIELHKLAMQIHNSIQIFSGNFKHWEKPATVTAKIKILINNNWHSDYK